MPAIAGTVQKVRAEAERLEVMDKAAGILAELLYTEKLLTQIKEYRAIMLHVSQQSWCWQAGETLAVHLPFTILFLYLENLLCSDLCCSDGCLTCH